MIKESLTEWTATNEAKVYIRVSNGFVYKKEVEPFYYGGFRIHKVGMDTLLGKEWINLQKGGE